MLPEKSPCYAFYSYPTPPPPPSAVPAPTPKASESPAKPSDMFRGSVGGARPVQASWAPASDSAGKEESKPDAPENEANNNGDSKMEESKPETEVEDDEAKDESAKDAGEEKIDEEERPSSSLQSLDIASDDKPAAAPAPASATQAKVKGRVLFLYTCPSSSPIKFRMVYSSGVRGIQQDATDKAGIDISGKVRCPFLITESQIAEGWNRSKLLICQI